MQILNVSFEQPLRLKINGQYIQVIAFKTQEHGNIKFGVDAPRSVQVHREEIYHAIQQQKQTAQNSESN